MNEIAVRFVTEIVKPWELLNAALGNAFCMNPPINDFTTRAHNLAVSIKHLPEATAKAQIDTIVSQSQPYQVISDLADSFKHGKLRNPERQCRLSVASMFEKNSAGQVRFLRNRITIHHGKFGRIDFMVCALEGALFVQTTLDVHSSWSPKVFNNSGEFSDEIKVHASKNNQVVWTGLELQIVQLNETGEYENVDLNGTVKFVLSSEF